jgi:hypothetical protein
LVCQAFCHYAQSAERIASYSFGSCIELLASLFALACRLHISHQHIRCNNSWIHPYTLCAKRYALCDFTLDFSGPLVYFSCSIGGSSSGRTHDSGSCYGGSNPPPPAIRSFEQLSVICYSLLGKASSAQLYPVILTSLLLILTTNN